MTTDLVALAGVDVHVSSSVFTATVDDRFAVELLVVIQRVVGSESVGVDRQ